MGTHKKRSVPELWWYNFLRAWGEPPMGVWSRKTTPSMSNAIPNEGLVLIFQSSITHSYKPSIKIERERESLLTVEFASEAERKSVEIWRRRVRAMIAFCYCLGAVNVKPFWGFQFQSSCFTWSMRLSDYRQKNMRNSALEFLFLLPDKLPNNTPWTSLGVGKLAKWKWASFRTDHVQITCVIRHFRSII